MSTVTGYRASEGSRMVTCRIRLLAAAFLLVLVLAACGGGDDLPATAPGDEPAEGTSGTEAAASGGGLVTLDRVGSPDAPNSFTFQVTQSHSPQAPTPTWAEGFQERYQAWAEENPDWRIDMEVIPAAEVTNNMAVLLEEANVGRAPDCAEVDSFVIAQFIAQDLLQPLNEFFTQEEIDAFFPFVQDVVVDDNGDLRAFWWNTDLRVLYYRTDLIPEPPETWDEHIDAALAAEEQDPNVDGYLFNGGRWEATTFDNLAHFWSQGGDLVDEEGRPIFGEGENREYMLNMLNFLQRTVDSGAAPQRVNTIIQYDEFNTAAQTGTVASFLGGHWQYAQLEEILPEEEFSQWDFTMIPGETPEADATGTGGWTFGGLTDDPDKLAACMDFVKSVYYGPANEITSELPTSTELYDSLEGFQSDVFERFKEFLEFGRARPGVPVYPQISNELQVGIGEMITGQLTPEEVVDQAFSQAMSDYEASQ